MGAGFGRKGILLTSPAGATRPTARGAEARLAVTPALQLSVPFIRVHW
jgi:hypothetical protein